MFGVRGGGNGRCITVGSILISLLTTCFADYASYGSWEEMTEKPGCVSAQTNIVRKWDDLIDNKYLKLHTDKHVQTELQGAVCQRRCLRKAPMKKFKVKYVSNSTHARAEWSNFPRSPRVVRPHSWNSWNWCLFLSFEESRIQKKTSSSSYLLKEFDYVSLVGGKKARCWRRIDLK